MRTFYFEFSFAFIATVRESFPLEKFFFMGLLSFCFKRGGNISGNVHLGVCFLIFGVDSFLKDKIEKSSIGKELTVCTLGKEAAVVKFFFSKKLEFSVFVVLSGREIILFLVCNLTVDNAFALTRMFFLINLIFSFSMRSGESAPVDSEESLKGFSFVSVDNLYNESPFAFAFE